MENVLQSGHLSVGDGHELYFETCGNPDGIPVLFLHGGPGLGFTDRDKRFFDLHRFFVVLFDQRGAGRSHPRGELADNTTSHLVQDMVTLLDHLKIKQALLFGGSWGSTLALLFGIQFPQRVLGMVIRGIFPATRDSINYYLQGEVARFYPDAWARFRDMVPKEEQHDMAAYYVKMMQSDDEKLRYRYAYEWDLFGLRIAMQKITLEQTENAIAEHLDPTHALMVAWYSMNYCFLPDNHIYDHAHIIKNIPIRIVHGRYDMVCPPVFAYDLYQKLDNAQLHFVNAGHVSSEPEIEEKLVEQLQDILAFVQ